MSQNQPSKQAIKNAVEMMREAVEIETDFAKHVTAYYPIMGVSIGELVDTINNYANDRMSAIGLEKIFPSTKETGLQRLVKKFSIVNNTRSNFFESGAVSGYAKDSISMDDF